MHRLLQRTPHRPTRWISALAAAALTAGLSVAGPTPALAAAPSDGLVVQYDFTAGTGNAVPDRSGNGRGATLVGDAVYVAGSAVHLQGDGYVRLPDDLMKGLSSITVSARVRATPGQRGPMIWALGNTDGGNGNGYLYTSGLNSTPYRTSIATGNWSTEQTAAGPDALDQDGWKTLTYTLGTDDVARIYADGVQVAEKSGVTIDPGQIGNGTTTANAIGRAVYAADPLFTGDVRNFSIYDHALSPAEVAELAPTATQIVAADKSELTLGDTSAVTANLTLPRNGPNGSAITWATSDAAVVSASGVVTQGAAAATVTLAATLKAGSAPNEATQTVTFTVTVPARATPQQQAEAAAAALTVNDADDVRGNLTLPGSAANGATVTWGSSNAAVIDSTGVVHRPANGRPSAAVTLTATVTVGSASATRVFATTVPALPVTEPYEGYLSSYFTGESPTGEQVYFAASNGNNALSFSELNGGQPSLISTFGDKGVRDPFLIRSPEGDKFFVIATDLRIANGAGWGNAQQFGSKYLEIWESTDLVHWSEQRHVQVSSDQAGMTWAPEATYDPTIGAYVVYWASNIYAADDPGHTGATHPRMMYATTRDFVTFTAAQVWNDPGQGVIDATVAKEGDTYYRVTTDGAVIGTCNQDIVLEKSDDLLAVDLPNTTPRHWQLVDDCIRTKAGTGWVEGPSLFHSNAGDVNGSKWFLFADETAGRGYIPFQTDSLATPDFTLPASWNLPRNPRHGTILPITKAELARVTGAPEPVRSNADGLVAGYTMGRASGTTVVDTSGNGYDATLMNGATVTDGAVDLDGVDDYVKLPDNLLSGVDAVTVTSQVWVDPAQVNGYFLWGLGNTGGDGSGNGYLFATGDPYRSAIATGNWSTEQGITTTRSIVKGGWHTITLTQGGGTQTLYMDGVKVGDRTGVTITPAMIGAGRTTRNAIGRSVYDADRTLKGKIRSFQLYNRALSATEVAALAAAPQVTATVSAAGGNGWYGDGAALTLTGTAGATLQYKWGSNDWTTWTAAVPLPTGTTTIAYRAIGSDLQTSAEQTLTSKVDGDQPTVTGSLSGRQVIVTASDASSGVASTEYRIDGAAWAAYTGPVSVDDAAHSVEFRATDNVGHLSAIGQVLVPAVTSDGKAVVAVAAANPVSADGWYRSPVVVTVAAPNGSTTLKVQRSIDGGNWRTSPPPFTVAANGTHSIRTRVLSNNVVVAGSEAELIVRLDRTAPTTSVLRWPSASGTPRNPVSLTFSAMDALSGVASIEYAVNGTGWVTAGADPVPFSAVGNYVVSYRATDKAGNVAAARSTTVTIATDPATTVTLSSSRVAAGSPLTVVARGFGRYEQLSVTVASQPVGVVTTDASGSARLTLVIPTDIAKGATTAVVSGGEPALSAQAKLTVS